MVEIEKEPHKYLNYPGYLSMSSDKYEGNLGFFSLKTAVEPLRE